MAMTPRFLMMTCCAASLTLLAAACSGGGEASSPKGGGDASLQETLADPAPEGETAVTSAMGTPPVPIFRRSESSTSSSLSDSTDRSAHCTGQRDTSQGSSSDSARGHDPAAPVRDRGGLEPRALDTS